MQKRSRRSSGIWWLACMVLVLTAAGAATVIFASEPGLLDHATRLASAEGWIPEYGGYFWETDRSVLSFRPAGPGLNAVSVDVKTGAEIARAALSKDFIESHASNSSQWRLSPDGNLLIWRIDNIGAPRWIVSDLAGRRIKTWTQSNGAFSPLWLADNRRWMDYAASDGRYLGIVPIIHSLDGPDIRCAPITGPYNWPLGITPDGRVVTFEWHPESSRIVWYAYPLASKPAPTESHAVSMPKSADSLVEAEVSPNGERIACLVHYTYLSPFERLVMRFLRQKITPHQKVGLWIIQRDGARAKLLGVEEGSRAASLLWTLDGRRISFYDRGALYSVSAVGE